MFQASAMLRKTVFRYVEQSAERNGSPARIGRITGNVPGTIWKCSVVGVDGWDGCCRHHPTDAGQSADVVKNERRRIMKTVLMVWSSSRDGSALSAAASIQLADYRIHGRLTAGIPRRCGEFLSPLLWANNAALCRRRFDAQEAKRLVEQYFGEISRDRRFFSGHPRTRLTSVERITMEDQVQLPRLHMAG